MLDPMSDTKYFWNIEKWREKSLYLHGRSGKTTLWESGDEWFIKIMEAATWGVLWKKSILKVPQKSQENTCTI